MPHEPHAKDSKLGSDEGYYLVAVKLPIVEKPKEWGEKYAESKGDGWAPRLAKRPKQ
jgi:hypothetical protein